MVICLQRGPRVYSSLSALLEETDNEFPPTSGAREKSVGRSGAPGVEIFTLPTGPEEGHVPNSGGVFPGRRRLHARPPQSGDLGFQSASLNQLGIHRAALTGSCLTEARHVLLFKPRALLAWTIPELGGGGRGMTRDCRAYNPRSQASQAHCHPCLLFHSRPPAVPTLQESWLPRTQSPRAYLPTPTWCRLGATRTNVSH